MVMQIAPLSPHIRRYIPAVLIVIGLLLLGYVGSEYGQMFWQQHQLEKRWQSQQQRQTQSPSPGEAVVDDGLTRLTIPKIDLSAVVVEGTNRRSLLLGPGHMQSTAAPGEVGNSVITAHRDTFFRHIYELSKGDELVVQRNGKIYKYEVTGKKVVKPTDVSVIKNSDDSRMTLITCYPTYYIGPAPERLIIFSKLVEGVAQKSSKNPVDAAALPDDNSDSAR